jgi:hypothetical protein
MAWQDFMLPMLRVMVNDIAATTYPDDTLEQVLVVAAMQVSQETFFSQNFRADMVNVDITPDPTVDATLDDSYTNLVCLKAACIVNTGDAATAASQAISVKDGTSSIDLRGALEGKMQLLRQGWCAVYKDAKMNYQVQAVDAAGAAVMTPFRIFAFGPGYLRGIPANYRPESVL